MSKTNDKDVLQLYSPECCSCGHLIEFFKKTKKPCHYREGNAGCPAQLTALIVVGKGEDFTKMVEEMKEVLDGGSPRELRKAIARFDKRRSLGDLVMDRARKMLEAEKEEAAPKTDNEED